MRVGAGLGLGVSSADRCLCGSPQAGGSVTSTVRGELDSNWGSPDLETHKEKKVLPRLGIFSAQSQGNPENKPGLSTFSPRKGCRHRVQGKD